jgi:hypothetical protein
MMTARRGLAHWWIGVATACGVLGVGSTTFAQEQQDVEHREPSRSHDASLGPQFGARVGYAVGAGSVYSGLGVSDASSGTIPVIVDIGWRMMHHLYVGAYGQVAPVLLREDPRSCPQGFDCSAQNWRMGLQVDAHLLPHTRVDPYVGIGGGYEILHTHVSGNAPIPLPSGTIVGHVDQSVTDRGWEFGNLTVGFDYRFSHGFGLGPFGTATLARYNVRDVNRTVTVGGTEVPTPVASVDHALHEQFLFGLRGTFNR